jgi:pyruvate dehydrogenase E2 component (dihydrolipoamide acetyltransferase)
MATPIEMPKLGNDAEESLLARWYKQPGETVAAGDVIADIETEKSSFELVAPVGGTLLATFCAAGDVVPVFTTVCVVGEPGEDVDQFRPGASSKAAAPAAEAAAPVAAPEPMGAAEAPAPAALAPAMSPRARRFAREREFFPSDVTGSGPGGRILEDDLQRLYERRDAPGAGLSLHRGTIARRMRQSLASTAQYTMNTSAVATGLLALRERVKSAGAEDAAAVNINAMVLFCAVRALEDVPDLNVEFRDGAIHKQSAIHLGFACDTPRGLLVPVIRDAGRMTLPQLAAEAKRLSAQAIAGTLPPDQLSGGTFTVSNLGTYGIESFSPILNPPQVAILGVNAIQLKPVRRNGTVEFVDHIGLSLTCDHQVIDGAPGARFLRVVGERIENIERIAALF